eukprot:11828245-Heterocapsa_arctica.AAC.1
MSSPGSRARGAGDDNRRGEKTLPLRGRSVVPVCFLEAYDLPLHEMVEDGGPFDSGLCCMR